MSADHTNVIVRERTALRSPAARLLGREGVRAVESVIDAVGAEACRREWPITAARVCVAEDPEDHAARTVELVFTLRADPEQAEQVLAECYRVLEACISGMNGDVRERLMDTLFFDVEPA